MLQLWHKDKDRPYTSESASISSADNWESRRDCGMKCPPLSDRSANRRSSSSLEGCKSIYSRATLYYSISWHVSMMRLDPVLIRSTIMLCLILRNCPKNWFEKERSQKLCHLHARLLLLRQTELVCIASSGRSMPWHTLSGCRHALQASWQESEAKAVGRCRSEHAQTSFSLLPCSFC